MAKKLKEYQVCMRMTTYFTVGVTATSAKEAVDMAQRADLERFEEEIEGTSYWANPLHPEDGIVCRRHL